MQKENKLFSEPANTSYTAQEVLRDLPHTTFMTIQRKFNEEKNKEEKIPIGIKPGRLDVSDEGLKKMQFDIHDWMEIQPMRTNNIFIVDVDEKTRDMEQHLPALKNTVMFETVNGYHYYIKINNFPEDKHITDEVNIFKDGLPVADLLHFKKVVWEKKDRKTQHKDMVEIDFEILKNLMKQERIVPRQQPKKLILEEPVNEPAPVSPKSPPTKEADNDEVKNLLSLLKPERCDSYDSWILIAQICKNEKVNFTIFDSWSSQSSHYNQEGNIKLWAGLKDIDNYQGQPVTLGTLHKMAKEDNPEKYAEIFNGLKSYAETKKEFEKNHFKVMKPLLFVTVDETGELDFKIRADFKNAYENLFYKSFNKKGEAQTKAFVDDWLKDKEIRTYKKIDFIPSELKPSGVYNLYTGLEIDKTKPAGDVDLTPIKYHIEKVLCNDDKAGYEYFYKWLAQIVQQPDKLSNIAVVFISGQGAGKNTFFDWFGRKVLGSDYYTSTSDIEHLLGRFAQGLKNKFIVNLDETNGKETFANSNRLKNLIVAPVINYEKKGVDCIDLNNYCRFVFTTNNSTPIKVESDDRRFVVFECSDELKNNREYFKNLYVWLGKKESARAFYDFLMSIDISNVDWVNDRPKTKIYEELRKVNIPLVARFLGEYVVDAGNDRVKATPLFGSFNTWLERGRYKAEYNATAFGRELMKYPGIEKSRLASGQQYSFDIEIIKNYLIKKGFYEDIPLGEESENDN